MTKPPVSTYRVQLHKEFTFNQTAAILPYLKKLHISDIYLSPIMEATAGSIHGYDSSDFSKISTERGGEEGFAELEAACADLKFEILLDIVPNHMGIDGENPYWLDILAKGTASAYWRLFDLRPGEDGKLHLPILDKPLNELIEADAIALFRHPVFGSGIKVNDTFLPLNSEGERLIVEGFDENWDALLGMQHYRLVLWTEVFEKLNYRRFFDITGLIGVRVEDPEIYKLSHQYLFALLKKYKTIRGVRVDHIDGLADPNAYLRRLHEDVQSIWVEKILSGSERLPPEWQIEGTTGYEFINRLNHLLIDPVGYDTLASYWTGQIEPRWPDFPGCVRDSKAEALERLFPSELKRLVALSDEIPGAEIFWREMIVSLPVYRTYAGQYPLSTQDKTVIDMAVTLARQSGGSAFSDAASSLLPKLLEPKSDHDHQLAREWQQLSGPAMAKGLEDTAHYRFNPLSAMNEVGCEPHRPAGDINSYVDWIDETSRAHPNNLLATSTHDTKRSEDTRHRLYALADLPLDWISFYETSVKLNTPLKAGLNLRPATEYFLYQSIIGVWPFDGKIDEDFKKRIADYMLKSVKEARTETSWLETNEDYETALQNFIVAILGDDQFVRLAHNFASRLMKAGALNSLSALTLKILGGGVPDIYQGQEMWDFSLVDPDNRRPVNFEVAAHALEELETLSRTHSGPGLVGHLMANWKNPAAKLWLTRTLLAARETFMTGPAVFAPLELRGPDSDAVIAYTISFPVSDKILLVACARYAGQIFADDEGPLAFSLRAGLQEKYSVVKNVLTGEDMSNLDLAELGQLFLVTPVIVLEVKI